ncbi:MAG: hypothetical protein JW751_05150 [Polyangiaceae bacterium]|nr:hypothetical protein [Polyangiaceae bacterium]
MRAAILCLLAVLLTLAPLTGCRCSKAPAVAELVKMDGTVERDFAGHERNWSPAAPGARFQMGDGIRAAAASHATLALAGEARLLVSPGGSIRFLPHGPLGYLVLDVEVGEAVLETSGQRVRVSSSFGQVVIDPQSRVVMERSDKALSYSVELGKITLGEEGPSAVEVGAGQGISVELGGVILEPVALGSAAVASTSAAASATLPPPPQEIVATTRGNGAQHRVPGVQAWQPLPAGESRLAPGTGVRVTGKTQVSIQRGEAHAELTQGEFVIGLPGGTLVQASGPVRLSASGSAVTVPGGVIVPKGSADTTAEIELGADQSARVRVLLGAVELRGARTDEARGGETGTLSAKGEVEITGRAPSPANLVINGGDSCTVHDPTPPTVVGFRLGGRCPKGAIVEVSGQSFASQEEPATAPFAIGSLPYRVRCLTRKGPDPTPVAKGTVVVVRDSGQKTIASYAAPSSHVNTDGRRYTVLYQNQLPQVSIGWATAPAATSFTLVLTGPLNKKVTSGSAQASFPSGSLPEGTYQVYFEAAMDPPRRSRSTTIALRFDNATPTATIAGPLEVEPGAKVPVTGTALPGWRVYLGDQELPLDPQQRFAGEAESPTDGAALPIRFEHPTRGTHYYLRRTIRR